jgi:MscS family membrane protein
MIQSLLLAAVVAVPPPVRAVPAGAEAVRGLRAHLPEWSTRSDFLGLQPWQWIGLGLLLVVALVVSRVTRRIIRTLCDRAAQRRSVEFSVETVRRAAAPIGLFVASFLWLAALRFLELPEAVHATLRNAAELVATASAVWAAIRLVDLFAELTSRAASKRGVPLNRLLTLLVTKAIKIALVALGVVYLAKALGIEILPLITGLGLGGLAMALAAKDTVENFFGSISVLIDRPFDVGDSVRIGDVEGQVVELGLRSTRVRTRTGSIVTIPNANLVRTNVENRGPASVAIVSFVMGVRSDTDPQKLAELCALLPGVVAKAVDSAPEKALVSVAAAPGLGRLDVSVSIPSGHSTSDEIADRRAVALACLEAARRAGVVSA